MFHRNPLQNHLGHGENPRSSSDLQANWRNFHVDRAGPSSSNYIVPSKRRKGHQQGPLQQRFRGRNENSRGGRGHHDYNHERRGRREGPWVKLRKPPRPEKDLYCNTCARGFEDENAFTTHIRSSKHKNMILQRQQKAAIEAMESSSEDENPGMYVEEHIMSREEMVKIFKRTYTNENSRKELPEDFQKWVNKSFKNAIASGKEKKSVYQEVAAELAVAKHRGMLNYINWAEKPPATGRFYTGKEDIKVALPLIESTKDPAQGRRLGPDCKERISLQDDSQQPVNNWLRSHRYLEQGFQTIPFPKFAANAAIGKRSHVKSIADGVRLAPYVPLDEHIPEVSKFVPRSYYARRLQALCGPRRTKLIVVYHRDFSIPKKTDTEDILVGTASFELVGNKFDFEREDRTFDTVRPPTVLGRVIGRVRDHFLKNCMIYTEARRQLDAVHADLKMQKIRGILLAKLFEAYAEVALCSYKFEDAGKALDDLIELYKELGNSERNHHEDRYIACWIYHRMKASQNLRDFHLILNWARYLGPATKFAMDVLLDVRHCNYAKFFSYNVGSRDQPLQTPQIVLSSLDPFLQLMRCMAIERIARACLHPKFMTVEELSIRIGFWHIDKTSRRLAGQVDLCAKFLEVMGLKLEDQRVVDTTVSTLNLDEAHKQIIKGNTEILGAGIENPRMYG